MPVKYSLYRTVCFIVAGLVAVFFIDVLWLVGADGGPDEESVVPILVLICFCVIYFLNAAWGIKLTNRFKEFAKVTKKEKTLIIVIFSLQLIAQIFLAYLCMSEIKTMVNYSRSRAYAPYFLSKDPGILLIQTIPMAVFALTIYSQIFTFPLIRNCRKNHEVLMKQINDIGATKD